MTNILIISLLVCWFATYVALNAKANKYKSQRDKYKSEFERVSTSLAIAKTAADAKDTVTSKIKQSEASVAEKLSDQSATQQDILNE